VGQFREGWVVAKLKHGGLCGSGGAQLVHFERAVPFRLVLFSLDTALGFVPLFLLPCLFFLALGKR
jgi:hypothetical protein